MKYAIRLKSKVEAGFKVYLPDPVSNISEHTGGKNQKPLLFTSIGDAEVYAQSHEIHNYDVEAYT